ncbi:DUF3040 domain-containing protein [Qaidamihabitans albus]|uniref:DUF3040 domain-containing protein n=1 Tax=Qaidamihabitans albus TaxID=2795733 RepID=UPI0018F133BC|nr:DUF3040 domain-containing protein [Qaidamihabitans albus]
MALHDEEQRQLAEIERRLAEEDPRLAQRLERLQPFALSRAALTLAGLLASFFIGLIAIATGAELGLPWLSIAGAALSVAVPTLVVWRLWVRRLR